MKNVYYRINIFKTFVLFSSSSNVATKNVTIVHMDLAELQATIDSGLDTNTDGWGRTVKRHSEASLSILQWELGVPKIFENRLIIETNRIKLICVVVLFDGDSGGWGEKIETTDLFFSCFVLSDCSWHHHHW